MLENDTSSPAVVGVLILLCTALIAVSGLVVLLGWILRFPYLSSLGAGIPVAPSTAVLFVLYAAEIFLCVCWPSNRAAYLTSFLINLVGGSISLILLILSSQQIYLEIEHFGIPIVHAAGETMIGHMSPITAACLLIFSVSYLILPSPLQKSRRWDLCWWLACFLVVLGMGLLLAYIFGIPALYGSSFIPPAALTCITVIALGVAMMGLSLPPAWLTRLRSSLFPQGGHIYILVFMLLALSIVCGGYSSYHAFQNQFLIKQKDQLLVIANLKVKDLINWRKERLADAEMLHHSASFAILVQSYFDDPQNIEAQKQIENWLQNYEVSDRYDQARLLDLEGRTRISYPVGLPSISSVPAKRIPDVIQSSEVVFVDFYRRDTDGQIRLTLLVPITDSQTGGRVIGLVALDVDPSIYLYPYIKEWPSDSATAETLIVRRDGNDALFLNDLRFKSDTALNLHIPLDHTDVLAVKAVLGHTGVEEGVDYRGVKSIGALSGVPDSPWFLVARMDTAEIYVPLRSRLWQTIAIMFSAIVISATGLMVVWRQQRIRFYRGQAETAKALQESEERLRLAVSAGRMGTWDRNFLSGRLEWSAECKAMFGLAPETEMNDERFMNALHPEDRLPTDMAISEALEKHTDFNMEYRVIWADGTTHWIAAQGRGYYNEAGQAIRMSGVTFDITERRQTEQALKVEQGLMQTLMDNVPVQIYFKDLESRFIRINNAQVKLFGLSDFGQALGKTDFDFFSVEHAQQAYDDEQEILRTGLPISKEEKETWEDLPDRWVSTTKMPLRDKDEKIIGTFGISMNITERKRMEEALRESERKLRESQEMAHLGFWFWDVKTGYVEWSEEVFKIFHLDPKEFTPQIDSILALSPWPEDHQRDQELINRAIETHSPGNYEQKFLRPDQSIGYYYSTFRGNYDENGDLVSIVGTVLDITERKQAEESLRESEERFSKAFYSSPVPQAIIAQGTSKVMEINDANCRLFGYSREELVDTTTSKLNLWENPIDRQSAVEELQKTGRLLPREANVRVRSGMMRTLIAAIEPISWKGIPCFIVSMIDITERKQAEEALLQVNKRLALAQRLSGAGIWDWDLATGKLNWTPEFFHLFGLDPAKSDATFDTWRGALHPDDIQGAEQHINEAIRDHVPLFNEYRIVTPSGELRWIGVWGDTTYSEHGEALRMTGLCIDITERKQNEERLAAERALLHTLIDNLPDSIFIKDPDSRIIVDNAAHRLRLGADTVEQVTGKTDFDFYSRELALEYYSNEQQIIKSGEALINKEEPIVYKDGRHGWLLTTKIPLSDSQGLITGLVGISHDITEQKQAEQIIRSLARFPAENPGPVLRITRDGNLLYANEAALTLLADWKLEMGTPVPEILAEPSLEVFETQTTKLVELLCGKRIFSINISPVAEDNYVNLYGRDVTDRVQAENMIEARLRLVEFAAKHSLDEVLTKALDEVCAMTDSPIGFYHFVEPDQVTLSLQACSTSAMPEYDKVEGKGLLHGVDQAGSWMDCIRQRQPIIHNDYASLPASRRKNFPEGHVKFVRELMVPVTREDWVLAILSVGNKTQDYTEKDIEIVAYFADVTWEIAERKRAEKQLAEYTGNLEQIVEDRTRELREIQEQLIRQERLATLGQLAGSIGHELRNPLGVISNAIYFLKMTQPNASDKVREYLDIIEKEARTSDKIVTDLLDFTRIKSIDRQSAFVSELIHQTLNRFLVPPSVDVTLDIQPDLPPIFADPHHVVQILGNLTTNACQALPSTGGQMVISAALDADMVAISVRDNGMGIMPENLGKIFEPLFTTKIKGIGLGLAVSRKLAEANGGRIEVESEAGKGSTFTVYLPVHGKSA
jgi:PAS domain S-box-containing protein